MTWADLHTHFPGAAANDPKNRVASGMEWLGERGVVDFGMIETGQWRVGFTHAQTWEATECRADTLEDAVCGVCGKVAKWRVE